MKTLASRVPKLSSLMKIHRRLDQILQDHRVALMEGDLSLARKLFTRFAKELRLHKQDEDEVILPLYEQRAGQVEGGDPRFFHAEHKKIEQFLKEFERAMRSPGLQSPQRRLALLDREAQFINYMLHHDLRERNALYPILDRKTTPQERRQILARLRLRR